MCARVCNVSVSEYVCVCDVFECVCVCVCMRTIVYVCVSGYIYLFMLNEESMLHLK